MPWAKARRIFFDFTSIPQRRVQEDGSISHVSDPKLTFWGNFPMVLHGFAWRNPKNMFSTQNLQILRALPRACQIMSYEQQFQHETSSILNSIFNPIHIFGTSVRFWIQFSAQSTFSDKNSNNCFNMCSNNCFLLEQFLIVAACPGASWQGNRGLFPSGGVTFFEAFFEAPFLLK